MLKKMRRDFKRYSWLLWIVIVAFLVGFSFTDAFKSDSGTDTDLFTIAGITVQADTYYTEVLQTLEYYSKQFNNKISQSLIKQLRVPEQVLQRMINTAIIRKEAKSLKISVSDKELSDKIKNYSIVRQDEQKVPTRTYIFREGGQASGRFIGKQRYEELLGMNRIKVKEFEKERRDEIINEKFMQLVTGPLVIGEETLREDYKVEKDKVNLEFVVLRPDRIKEKINITDGELNTYYENHKEDFKTAEKRKGSAIVYKFDDFKKDIKISDKDLFDYYRENKDSFFVPGKTKVSRIFLEYDEKNREVILKKAEELQKELTPENFALKAGEVSQDAMAKQGGDHGYQGWQSFSEQEKTIIEGLGGKGISTPIDTQQGGFSLIFVSEKVEKHQEPFDNVKDRIRGNFENEQLNKLVQNKIGKAYNKLKDEKDIKSKAEALNIKIIETGDLKNGDPIKEVDEAGYVSRALFTMDEGEVSTPVEFMKGMAIVQLTEIIKPEIEPFENVKDQVKNRAEMTKKIELLDKDSQKVTAKLNALKDEKEIEKYLKDEKFSSTAYEYKRGNKLSYLPGKEGLDEIIFTLEEGRFSSPIKFENQVAIVKIKSKNITDDSDKKKKKIEFYNQKLNNLKMNFFAFFVSLARPKYRH